MKFINIHREATMADDRYVITEAERKKGLQGEKENYHPATDDYVTVRRKV